MAKTVTISLPDLLTGAVLAFLLLLPGCGSSQEQPAATPSPQARSSLEQISDELSAALEKASRKVSEIAPSGEQVKQSATGEVEKLYIFEYKVAEFSLDATAGEIESELNSLGKERWECFASERTEKNLRVMCKRRPKTYLRYIPRMF